MAYSTRSRPPEPTLAFFTYWSGDKNCSSSSASWTSPYVPRTFTFVRTFLQVADVGGEGLHLADALVHPLKLLDYPVEGFPKRVSSVVCNFSSTVCRISSSLVALSCRIASSLLSTAVRKLSWAFSIFSVRPVSAPVTLSSRSFWM